MQGFSTSFPAGGTFASRRSSRQGSGSDAGSLEPLVSASEKSTRIVTLPQRTAQSRPKWRRDTATGLLAVILLSLFVSVFTLSRNEVLAGVPVPWTRPTALHKPVEAVTVLMTSTKWLPQLLVMSYALTRHSPHRDRVLIVPQQYQDSGNFPAAGLDILQRRLGWKVRWVEHIPVPLSPEGEETFPIYRDVMNKIHIFNMTEYTAVAFFDLDGMILGSLDEAFAALYASGMKFASVGDEGGIDHVKLAPQAGSMFVVPDRKLFQEIVEFKEDTSKYDNRWPEQLMLNIFFWGRWLCLPAKFGLQALFAEHAALPVPYSTLRTDARFLHMTLDTKPWAEKLNKNKLVQADQLLWRALYREAVALYNLTASELLQKDAKSLFAPSWDPLEIAGL